MSRTYNPLRGMYHITAYDACIKVTYEVEEYLAMPVYEICSYVDSVIDSCTSRVAIVELVDGGARKLVAAKIGEVWLVPLGGYVNE